MSDGKGRGWTAGEQADLEECQERLALAMGDILTDYSAPVSMTVLQRIFVAYVAVNTDPGTTDHDLDEFMLMIRADIGKAIERLRGSE